MKCILCNKEIFSQFNLITIDNITVHWDCWYDLEPTIKFSLKDTNEKRKQMKADHIIKVNVIFKSIVDAIPIKYYIQYQNGTIQLIDSAKKHTYSKEQKLVSMYSNNDGLQCLYYVNNIEEETVFYGIKKQDSREVI